MSHQAAVTRQKVEKSLQKVQQILDNTRNPILASDVSHRYIDKMTLAEFLTKSSISSVFACLTKLGVSLDQFQTFKQWSSSQAVTLRLRSEEKCRFLRQETREVESKSSHVIESSLFGKTTSKVVTTVTDYIWEFSVSYWLEGYRGTGADSNLDCISILSRTSSCDLVTTSDKSPKVEHRMPPPLEVSLSWLLQRLDVSGTGKEVSLLSYPLSPNFSINTADEACFTPRRNPDVEAALFALNGLNRWCQQVHDYFSNNVFSQAPDRRDLDMSVIRTDTIFVPVLPLLHPSSGAGGDSSSQLEQKTDDVVTTSSSTSLVEAQRELTLSVSDTNAFLQEQHRTLSAQCEAAAAVLPAGTAHRSLISAAEGTLLVTLLHLGDIAQHYEYGVDYIEELLRDQLIAAIGKVIQPKDFSDYMKYHNTKLLKPAFQPRPFCYTVRRSGGHAPEGGVFLEELAGGASSGEQAQAINTLVSSTSCDAAKRQFTLSASTTVSFTGSTYVHAYMSHRFQNDHQAPTLQLRAEARQFSGFIVLIGSIPTATTFDPQHAFICKNKDEFTIPLDTEMIPSPKAFRDAIESLSPEQQRFAKAFRSMQLASTLFGVLVVQIKPQLEKILNLPPDSLTKEIKLNQDLMELFIKYQIPCDLLSYDTTALPGGVGADVVSVREKLNIVKGNVEAIHEVIGLTKRKELEEHHQELHYARELTSSLYEEDECFALNVQENMAPPMMMMKKNSAPQPAPKSRNFAKMSKGGSAGGGRGAPRPLGASSSSAPISRSSTTVTHTSSSARTSTVSTSSSQSNNVDGANMQSHHPNEDSVVDGLSCGTDCTLLPAALNEKFDRLDKDGAVRPLILSVGKNWKKRHQEALLAAATTTTLHGVEEKEEKSAAFDLLDALSRSGGLALENTDMHVVLMSTHCFDKTLMNTIIQKNTNPIEKMEQSTLVMASVIHGKSAEELAAESQHERLQNQAAMLFLEE